MSDYYGSSSTQPCTWIRPDALKYNFWGSKPQIVGHTTEWIIDKYVSYNEDGSFGPDFWVCDTLGYGYYMIIEDGKITIKNIKDEN